MKRVLPLLLALFLFSSSFAVNYLINSGGHTDYTSSDQPIAFYLKGHSIGEAVTINVQDLSNDGGPGMKFRIVLFGTQVDGYTMTMVNEGDATFIIPGAYVGEQTIVVLYDMNRLTVDPSQPNGVPVWKPQQCTFNATQDVAQQPALEVLTKDHHLGHPSIYVHAMYIRNVGNVTVNNPVLRYYFTVESSSNNPVLVDYYTPNSDIRLLKVPGTNQYALELDYDGFTLAPNQTTLAAVENQIQLYYEGYQTIDKFNDYSNPIPEALKWLPSSTLYTINQKVAVYDDYGNLIEGTELPGFSKNEFVPVN